MTGGMMFENGTVKEMRKRIKELNAEKKELVEALQLFVHEYVELVDSGDAGYWNAEDEVKVIKARAAIAKALGEQK